MEPPVLKSDVIERTGHGDLYFVTQAGARIRALPITAKFLCDVARADGFELVMVFNDAEKESGVLDIDVIAFLDNFHVRARGREAAELLDQLAVAGRVEGRRDC